MKFNFECILFVDDFLFILFVVKEFGIKYLLVVDNFDSILLYCNIIEFFVVIDYCFMLDDIC